jgi:hypothetical protein
MTDRTSNERTLREALECLLPGLILDLRYATDDDDKDAMRSRITTVQDALASTVDETSVATETELLKAALLQCYCYYPDGPLHSGWIYRLVPNTEAECKRLGHIMRQLSSEKTSAPICPTCKTELAFEGDVCGLCLPVAQP